MPCPTHSLPRGFFSAHSPLHTLLPSITLISPRLNSRASCLDTASASPSFTCCKLKICIKPALFALFSSNVPLVLDVCSPLCGPGRGLHHLNNPMHTLFPHYPNRIALDMYQSLAAPFIRSTTTPPQLPHINSWASELCPPPSTGALTRLWRDNVSDVGGIPAFDTTPLDICTPAGSRVS